MIDEPLKDAEDRPGKQEREATKRAQYLKRKHDLSEKQALAVAYSEMGYSAAGIAKRIDSTKSTVSGYLRYIAEEYGDEAVYPKMPGDRNGPL